MSSSAPGNMLDKLAINCTNGTLSKEPVFMAWRGRAAAVMVGM